MNNYYKITLTFYESREIMPDVKDNFEGESVSKPCIIKGRDKCVWLANWDGTVWRRVNYGLMTFDKDYVTHWGYIPRLSFEDDKCYL